jgi:hypothetical protein
MIRRSKTYDDIHMATIVELLKDANVKLKDLYKELKVPQSTLQRIMMTTMKFSLVFLVDQQKRMEQIDLR